jgi:anti-sigma factor RsiW
MNCAQTQNLIHAYVDGELDLVRHLEIEHHLQDCATCAQAHESLQTLRTALASNALYHKAPLGLRERLQAAGRPVSRALPLPRRFPRRWLGLAAAAAAIALLSFGLGRFVEAQSDKNADPTPTAKDLLAQEVLSSHVRSLAMNHIADVESTDQHTVKPWFAGKVNYTLPVKKLSDEGFPLFGGRVDYVADQSVATLVYQRDKHFINLYVWPADKQPDAEPESETRRDFNLIHWVRSEKNYWAISDLNEKELKQFADHVRKP